MSEEAKVRHADKAITKIEVREKNSYVKIRNLKASNNRVVALTDRDSNGLIETR